MTNTNRNKRLFEGTEKIKSIVKKNHLEDEIEVLSYQKLPCIRVNSYRALIRIVGYFKYTEKSSVVLRGQDRCYRSLKASLHRKKSPQSGKEIQRFLSDIQKILDADKDPINGLTTEPLLQHYGINTRWLDVVDSVPHAVFFASYKHVVSPFNNQLFSYIPSNEECGVIYLIGLGDQKPIRKCRRIVSGLYKCSNNLKLVDLRKNKPSIALRPHAQHGLLISSTDLQTDIWDRLVARIIFPNELGRRWINSQAFEPCELFPHRHWDGIYGNLLKDSISTFLKREYSNGRDWGSILRYDFHK
ncbi:MAG: FRG domain-containing protein [Candidatus Ozemobacteraceae bacterium]